MKIMNLKYYSNEGGEGISQRRAGELYDAFAGGEEYLPDEIDEGKGRRRSGEEIDDRDMGGFLADSEDDDEDVVDEKGDQRLLKGKR